MKNLLESKDESAELEVMALAINLASNKRYVFMWSQYHGSKRYTHNNCNIDYMCCWYSTVYDSKKH